MTDAPDLASRRAGPAVAGVIDLQGGLAVHAVAGERDRYRPIVRPELSEPTAVALADWYRSLGVDLIYLADLEAIAGQPPAVEVYRDLLAAGHRLWVDAGVEDAARGARLAELAEGGRSLDAVIVAGESLGHPDDLAKLVDRFGPQRMVFSLDLKAGRPRVRAEAWRRLTGLKIARDAVDQGARRMIVLDLAAVGVGRGVIVAPLLRELRQTLPELELISGGGVRGSDDVREFGRLGCSTVLVATALLEGRLKLRPRCAMPWNNA